MSGPTKRDIAGWRHEYGRVFTATVRGEDWYFRPLAVGEYEEVLALEYDPTCDSESLVVEKTLLHPSFELAESRPAGVITTLAGEILSSSGFANAEVLQSYLDEHRQHIEASVIEMMYATIIAAMPMNSIEELRKLTLDSLLYRVAMAERVIAIHQTSVQSEVYFVLGVPGGEEEASQQADTQSESEPWMPGQVRQGDPIAEKLFQEGG